MINPATSLAVTRDPQNDIPASSEAIDVSGSGNESPATAFYRTMAAKPLWRGLFIVSVNTAMFACCEAFSNYFADERDGHMPLYPFNISQPSLGGAVLGFANGVFQASLTELFNAIHDTCLENRSISVAPCQPNVITVKDKNL